MNKLNHRHATVAVVAAVLLAACGTGGGSSAEAPPPSGTAGPTVTVTAVPSYISGLIANTSDSSTPVDANLVILADDNTGEPAAVN